jgi:ornithine cyclodeaminase/alanine dehydrogenase-like protein (mu-crystallin family)
MVLLLTHDEVAQLVTLEEAVKVMEAAYESLGKEEGVERPRTHTYVPLEQPELRYLFESMDGVVPSLGVAALRITSEMNPFKREAGVLRTFKVPLRQQEVKGDYWLGLVFLFNIHSGELMAILPDGLIGKIRMAAATAIAAKRLARRKASTAGILGSSWQAEGQLEGLALALDLREVHVYSPDPEHRKAFAEKMSEKLKIEVLPVNDPESLYKKAKQARVGREI